MRLLLLIFAFASTSQFHLAKCEDLDYKDLKVFENIINRGILNNMAEFSKQNSQYNLIKCFSDVDAWMSSLSKSLWPWKMMDASGKFPHGILRGNIYSLGQFDECLSINEKYKEREIKGKYCIAKVPVPSIGLTIVNMTMPYLLPNGGIDMPGEEIIDLARSLKFMWGVCVPNSCTASDINLVLKWIFQVFNIDSDFNNIRVDETECSVNEPKKFTGLDTFAILAFSTFGLLMLCSTAYDIAVSVYSKKKSHQHDLFIAFSLYTNTAKLVKINKSANSLRCIHGIRMLSMYWIIICHRYNNFMGLPIQNILDVLDWGKNYSAMIIGGGSVGVDTFFVLSGLLLAYVFSNQHERKKSFNILMFYLHRLFRLWPAMAALVLFYITIFKHLLNSPVGYTQIRMNMEPCLDNWWSTLLYIQNYASARNQCVGHLWYLSIDTQLYILSPILLIPILKYKRIALPNIIFWVVVAQATTATISYINNWAAVQSGDVDYWIEYYMRTHTRATVWLIGFLGGYLIYRTKNVEIKINKFVVILLWLLALSVMLVVIFGVKPMHDISYVPTHARDGTFNAFARSAWAIAICWVIFACLKGYGGPINWFLSWRFWEVLSRISYSMYLTHVMIQNVVNGSIRVPPHFMTFQVVYAFFGDLISSAAVAYIWVMAFESPFLAIEKFLFYPPKNNKATPAIKENIAVIPDLKAEQEIPAPDATLKIIP